MPPKTSATCPSLVISRSYKIACSSTSFYVFMQVSAELRRGSVSNDGLLDSTGGEAGFVWIFFPSAHFIKWLPPLF